MAVDVRQILVGLIATAALAVVGERPGDGAPGERQSPPVENEAARDVFLLLDRGPIHMRLRVTIAGKSPQAIRRDYLARLLRRLDTNGDGKLTRAEFERSPLNTSRRGPTARPLSEKEAAEIVPA